MQGSYLLVSSIAYRYKSLRCCSFQFALTELHRFGAAAENLNLVIEVQFEDLL